MYQVFISSTSRDLSACRQAVFEAINQLDGFHAVRMEAFGARAASAGEFCPEKVADCQVAVLILGLCYGSSPDGADLSYTEQEYEAAVTADIPRLAFLTKEGEFYPGYYREPDEQWSRQQQFRGRINEERIRAEFSTPEELAQQVTAALSNWARECAPAPGQAGLRQANLRGNGTIVQGPGVGAGKGGVAVGRDVHGDITIYNPGPAAEDRKRGQALRDSYLRRVVADCRDLELDAVDKEAAGQGGKARLRLQAVYTALLTRTPRRTEAIHEQPGREAERDEPPLSALEQLDRELRLVLLGDPGSGKSTFVNFVALCLAGTSLSDPDANIDLLTQPLPDEEGEDTEQRQPWTHDQPLPLRIVLRDFAARGLPPVGRKASARHLWAFVEAELEAADLADFAPFLKQELQDPGGLILFDGLDEVPEAEARRDQVKDAVEDFCKTYSRCRVMLTSRTYAYRQQGWQLAGFAQAELLPLGAGQIKRFVSRWYAHLVALQRLKAEDAKGRALLLRDAIFSQPRLEELAERPLLLTLMASLHAWRGGDLPDRRERLYAEAVDLLLYLWEQRRLSKREDGTFELLQPSVAEYLDSDREAVRKLLERLAYEVHAAQPDLTGTADIAESALRDGLMDLSANPDAKPKRLVEYLRDRAGLLTARGAGVYSFVHRSFQEYLAACHLTRHGYPVKIAELARGTPDRWREVALLAGAKAGVGTDFAVWSLVDALCYREPTEAGSIEDEWGALLAGQLLLESGDLKAVSDANRAKLERVRHWLPRVMIGTRRVARERILAGDTLAMLGDPRPEVMRVDFMQFCWVPAGPFVMGSIDDDPDAFGDEKPRQERRLDYGYWLARYPVTVAQFRAYVDEAGLESHDHRCLAGPTNHPVVWVSWREANAFCRWLTQRWRDQGGLPEGWAVALPSEAEWEKAARGGLAIPDAGSIQSPPLGSAATRLRSNDHPARAYPWGEDADPERMNVAETKIWDSSAVGCFPGGASPYGVEDLSGNVLEWTRSVRKDYPYDPTDGREDPEAPGGRVLRGGAFFDLAWYARCASRIDVIPEDRLNFIGFRVVVSPFFSGR